MHFSTTAALALAATSVSAAGTLFVDNNCAFPLYMQSGANGIQPGPVITLPAGKINAYHEVMRGPNYKNNFISVSRTPDLAKPLQVVYTQTTQGPAPGLNYYDLSTVFGDPLKAQGFELLSGGNGFSVKCPPRTTGDCPHTYSPSNKNGNGAIFTQSDNAPLVLSLCRSA